MIPERIIFVSRGITVLLLGQNRPEHVCNVRLAGDRTSKNANKILIGRRQAEMALGGGGLYTPYADGRT